MSTRTERWSVELLLRYVCATFVTWIAAAGAQLVVRTDFALFIGLLSLLGVPVSLYLRLHGMRILGFSLSRPLWNAFTVLLFFLSAGVWTLLSMSDLLSIMMSGGASQSFWLRFGAEKSLELLMEVFLLFAAFRSFALISDKDATLATVPSFSVLLLLIPVHRGIEVVLYFLLWTLSATTLFALDHRAELNEGADGRVPSPQPGQDVRMAARGLATVLGVALIAAFSLSALLTTRNADDRSATESAITGLAGRLAQFAMNSPDSSLNGGPERQIDFSSGPSLPSRALLWRVRVTNKDRQFFHPGYFRLLTLSRYNGSTWTPAPREQRQALQQPLTSYEWPPEYWLPPGNDNLSRVRFWNSPPQPPPARVVPPAVISDPRQRNGPPPGARVFRIPRSDRRGLGPSNSTDDVRTGYLIKKTWPELQGSFGNPSATLRLSIRSNTNNIGFIPLLPNTRALYLLQGQGRLADPRTGFDGAVDLGFVAQDQRVLSLSDVPRIAEYGLGTASAPAKKVAATPSAPKLAPSERALCLERPNLSERLKNFARQALAKSPTDESNYGKARRLAWAIQRGATYTLRPPALPEGREATDFFLFDGNRRGYCTHFAAALAVLCRAQGIPSRIVSGFAAQEYDSEHFALLREANAHAWTEIWVDNWGWAPVDATPSADRGDNAPNAFSYWGDWFGFAFNQVEMWSRSRLWVLGLLAGVVVLGIYGLRRRARILSWWARRRGRLSSDEWTRREIIAAYDTASVRLASLFRPRHPSETPDEWLHAADAAVLHSPRARYFARNEFEMLTQQYVRARYAAQAPENSKVAVARDLARKVRRRKRDIDSK